MYQNGLDEMDRFTEKLQKGDEEVLELAVECTGKYTKDVEE